MRIMTSSWNNEPQRASRPFSKDRDGFVIAEGAWFFIVEDMESAKARGARMYGEIAGYGSTCEAFHRVRLEECGEEPARAIGLALAEAGIPPSAVQYINYHGTSTELNDRIETRATKLAFNGHAYKLAGSSLKSLIGHPQGACGAAGVAATLLAMRDGVVPPTINVDQPDPSATSTMCPSPAGDSRSSTRWATVLPSEAKTPRWCCGSCKRSRGALPYAISESECGGISDLAANAVESTRAEFRRHECLGRERAIERTRLLVGKAKAWVVIACPTTMTTRSPRPCNKPSPCRINRPPMPRR